MFDFYDLTLVAAVLAVVEIIGVLLVVDGRIGFIESFFVKEKLGLNPAFLAGL